MMIRQPNSLSQFTRTKPKMSCLLLAVLAAVVPPALCGAAVPHEVNHQGVVSVNGQRFTGKGLFRFALVDPVIGFNRWTNDGSNESNTDAMPVAAVTLDVVNGVYSVRLGDPKLMRDLPPSTFEDVNLVLRIWFDDGNNGVEQLNPDHVLTSTGYAFFANQAGNADTVDGFHGEALEESDEIDLDIAIHRSSLSAHHSRYRDAEAADVAQPLINLHAANSSAHHPRYTDGEAAGVTQGLIDSHDSDSSAHAAALGAHASDASAHHAPYTDSDALGLIVTHNADSAAHTAAFATHSSNASAHHARYTDADAVAAVGPHTPPGPWNTSGTDVYYNGGNVGIGTSTPGAKLTVSGSLRLQAGTSVTEFSTDGTLGGSSNTAIPTERAVKTYVDASVGVAAGVPIGTVTAWLKSFPNTPALPNAWVQCNGQTLSDSGSVYNGQTIPNLNGQNRFLRGRSASGATGGSASHSHTLTTCTPNCIPWQSGGINNNTTTTANHLPPFYNVVWIMKVK